MVDALNRLLEKEKVLALARNLKARSARAYSPVPVIRRIWKIPEFTASIAEAVKEETFFAYNAEAATFRTVVGRSMTTA